MPTSAVTSGRTTTGPRPFELMLLVVGLLAMYVPTYQKLADSVWSQEGQGHGPIMLALVFWLAWHRKEAFAAVEPRPQLTSACVLFVLGWVLYVFGRSQDFPEFESGSQIFILSALILFYRGAAALKVMWFPLFFLLFVIPFPNFLVMAVTGPLKAAVSMVADNILYMMGYPVARSGVTLTVGPYRLLVADACAGINSIFALEAVGVFYMSLMNYASKARSLLLAIFIIPISFVSNVIRVLVLALVTYHFGDEVGQGFIHEFAGVMLFVVASILTILLDGILGLFMSSEQRPSTNAKVLGKS
jgi:exosortase B